MSKTWEQSETAKSVKVITAANKLADELDKEGKGKEAQAFRDLRLCKVESLARLYDILTK